MKRMVGLCLAAAVIMVNLGVAWSAEEVKRSNVVSAEATVVKVDRQNRTITLKGPEGGIFDLKAGPDVRNLEQLKSGDSVNVTYYESLLVQMAKPGQQPASSVNRQVERAKPGEKPGGAVAERISTTATVLGIDRGRSEVTLKGPHGDVVTVKAIDPTNLEALKPGDQLNITYTQAVAIQVEKAAG